MIGWIMDPGRARPHGDERRGDEELPPRRCPLRPARVGGGGLFVSEVDESTARSRSTGPASRCSTMSASTTRALEELRALFGDFLGRAEIAVVNADDPEAAALPTRHASGALCA